MAVSRWLARRSQPARGRHGAVRGRSRLSRSPSLRHSGRNDARCTGCHGIRGTRARAVIDMSVSPDWRTVSGTGRDPGHVLGDDYQ
jgi:hypothetical protein